jgi:hypothetical protein
MKGIINNRITILQKELDEIYEIIQKESFEPTNGNRDEHYSLMYFLYLQKTKLKTEIETLKWVLSQK